MEVERPAPALTIVWGAMIASVLAYGGIAWLLVPVPEASDPASWIADPVILVLHLAGFAALAASFVVPPLVVRRGAPERQAWILRWAMLESIAILGLLAAFLLADARAFLLLGFIALAALVLTAPRPSGDRTA